MARNVLDGAAETSGCCPLFLNTWFLCIAVDSIGWATSGRFLVLSLCFSNSGISQELWKILATPKQWERELNKCHHLLSFRGTVLWDIHSLSKSPVRLSSRSQGISPLSYPSLVCFCSSISHSSCSFSAAWDNPLQNIQQTVQSDGTVPLELMLL